MLLQTVQLRELYIFQNWPLIKSTIISVILLTSVNASGVKKLLVTKLKKVPVSRRRNSKKDSQMKRI